MFSLIVTLISIALVAALALATLYYGGPVFNQGAARAHAAKIAAQGQQIQGAAELYKADTGEYPISLAELVAQDYLKSVPVAAAQEQVLINSALAAASWVMVAPKTPVFALTGVSESVCKAVNLGSYGVEGILKTARQTNRVQCYGTSTGSLMIVQAKSPADLVAASTHPAAVIQVGTVLPAPIPAADSTDTSDAGWLVAPGTGTSVVTPPAVPQIGYFDDKNSPLSSLTLPPTQVGQTSTEYSVTVKNTGTVAVTLAAAGVTVAAPFAETSDTCASATLAPNSTCSVSVTFTPSAATSYSGASYALGLSSTAGALASLPLSGQGTVEAPPTSSLSAAECLVQHPNHNSLDFQAMHTGTGVYSALFNQCSRAITVHVDDNQWSPEFALYYGYQAERLNEATGLYDWAPGVSFGESRRWFDGDTSSWTPAVASASGYSAADSLWLSSLGVGHIRLELWMNWYGSAQPELMQIINSQLNSRAFLPFVVTTQAQSIEYPEPEFQSNFKVVKVKFQDQPDSEYLTKTLTITGI